MHIFFNFNLFDLKTKEPTDGEPMGLKDELYVIMKLLLLRTMTSFLFLYISVKVSTQWFKVPLFLLISKIYNPTDILPEMALYQDTNCLWFLFLLSPSFFPPKTVSIQQLIFLNPWSLSYIIAQVQYSPMNPLRKKEKLGMNEPGSAPLMELSERRQSDGSNAISQKLGPVRLKLC